MNGLVYQRLTIRFSFRALISEKPICRALNPKMSAESVWNRVSSQLRIYCPTGVISQSCMVWIFILVRDFFMPVLPQGHDFGKKLSRVKMMDGKKGWKKTGATP